MHNHGPVVSLDTSLAWGVQQHGSSTNVKNIKQRSCNNKRRSSHVLSYTVDNVLLQIRCLPPQV